MNICRRHGEMAGRRSVRACPSRRSAFRLSGEACHPSDNCGVARHSRGNTPTGAFTDTPPPKKDLKNALFRRLQILHDITTLVHCSPHSTARLKIQESATKMERPGAFKQWDRNLKSYVSMGSPAVNPHLQLWGKAWVAENQKKIHCFYSATKRSSNVFWLWQRLQEIHCV